MDPRKIEETHMMPTLPLALDIYDANTVLYCLEKGLETNKAVVELLKIAKERQLTADEKSTLPFTLVTLDREELIHQYDSWVSLVDHYNWLIGKVMAIRGQLNPVTFSRSLETS